MRRPKSTWRERGVGGRGETERDIYWAIFWLFPAPFPTTYAVPAPDAI